MDINIEDLKLTIQKHWDANVCDFNKGSNFAEIDAQRLKAYPYLDKELDLANDNGKTILEIGVGSGSDACRSLSVANPQRYVLYDLSPNTIAVSKSHLDEHCKGKPYELVNGDASNMSFFKNGEFDRVKAIGSIHHIPTYHQVFGEISRVLKPGGDFIFMFYNKNSIRNKVIYPRAAKKRGVTVSQLVLEVDGGTNPYTHLFTKSELQHDLSDAGLSTEFFSTYELPVGERSIRIGRYRFRVIPKFFERIWGFSLYVHGRRG